MENTHEGFWPITHENFWWCKSSKKTVPGIAILALTLIPARTKTTIKSYKKTTTPHIRAINHEILIDFSCILRMRHRHVPTPRNFLRNVRLDISRIFLDYFSEYSPSTHHYLSLLCGIRSWTSYRGSTAKTSVSSSSCACCPVRYKPSVAYTTLWPITSHIICSQSIWAPSKLRNTNVLQAKTYTHSDR